MTEDAKLYEAVGRILCRRYLCCYCSDLRDEMVEIASKGPRVALQCILDYDGMRCGAVQDMLDCASEAMRERVTT